jgi:hypothetical protein
MDWSNVGSISDIVSAIAIVGTLAYIAVQIRQTRMSAEAQASINAELIYSRWRLAMVQNSDLARVTDKANKGEDLSGAERIQIATLFDELFIGSSIAYANSAQTGSIHETQGDVDYMTSILDRNPGIIPEWHRSKHITEAVSAEFVATIEDHLAGVANN